MDSDILVMARQIGEQYRNSHYKFVCAIRQTISRSSCLYNGSGTPVHKKECVNTPKSVFLVDTYAMISFQMFERDRAIPF